MNGHYWCDKCDEPAFGAACQHCHQSARFIAAAAPLPQLPTERERRPQASAPVTQERGHQLFTHLRQKLTMLCAGDSGANQNRTS